MLQFHIEITGKEKALTQLDSLKRLLQGFRPELQKAGDYYLEFLIFDVFSTQGSVFQEPWAPLSKEYRSVKMRKHGSTQPLVGSGKMRASYKLYTTTEYFLIRNEARNAQGDYYAGYHQDGTAFMPQRMLMKFDTVRTRIIRDIIVDSINSRIKAAL